MEATDVPEAVGACVATASVLGLRADDAVVLHNSNRLAVRLTPCDVLARVAPVSRGDGARFEVDVARRLADTDTPLAQLDPRVEPRVYLHDRFAVTLWTYYEPVRDPQPAEYARALEQLHAGMRRVDAPVEWTPHFMDRVAEAQQAVENASELADVDRELLSDTLRSVPRAIAERHASEQLLHGEPHPGNLLVTTGGLLFIDLETCCRGPVEFDIAHTVTDSAGPPGEVSELYDGADQELVRQCWVLMLAMIAAWRFEPGDDLPNGRQLLAQWLGQLRAVRSVE